MAKTANAVLVLVVAVLAVGCGGSSGDRAVPASSGTRSAHLEFVAELEAMCSRQAADHVTRRYGQRASVAFGAENWHRAATLLERILHRVARYDPAVLEPPAADRAAFARYIGARARGRALTRELIDAMRAGKRARTRRLMDYIVAEYGRRRAAASDLGAERCAG